MPITSTAPPSSETTLLRVASLSAGATSLVELRRGVLAMIGELVSFDAALVHALSPRVPLSTAVTIGLDEATLAATVPRWDTFAEVLGPLRARANAELAVNARQCLGGASFERLEAEVLRPFRARALALVHLVVREHVVAVIALFSKRTRAFGRRELDTLRLLAPALAVADALHQRLDGVPTASARARLVCRDQRLTPRQREIVEHVAHGHTNAEIGRALGLAATSVRNHLVRVFEAVGAANRADLVRLAVLTEEEPASR